MSFACPLFLRFDARRAALAMQSVTSPFDISLRDWYGNIATAETSGSCRLSASNVTLGSSSSKFDVKDGVCNATVTNVQGGSGRMLGLACRHARQPACLPACLPALISWRDASPASSG